MDPNIIEGYDNTIQKVIPFLSEQLKFDPSLSVAKQFWPTGPRIIMNQDSSVAQRWATGWTIGVRVSARAGNFSLHHRVQTGSGAHPASHPMGTRRSSPVGKAAGP
jgi:tRNA A37 threonylcarbamoyladenosine synthetase subunit TsaC/SUA5/YrdC